MRGRRRHFASSAKVPQVRPAGHEGDRQIVERLDPCACGLRAPEAFGEYMRIQAGGVSQVCLALLCLACRYFLSMPCKRPSIVACILDYFLDS